MSAAAVSVRGLRKRFEATCALDGVDLTVAGGEVHGLLGPNGAGKTTLLRILFGLVRADAGTVELAEPRRVAGFVEEPRFYPYLTGRANLELLAGLDGAARGGGPGLAEVLERVGLSARAGDRVSGYSTGMRQRLGLAAALLRAPRLLLLDEPTSGLDPAGARELGVVVRELAADGVAVLLSSHQIAEVESVCDAFTVLGRGRVVWEGSAERLRREARAGSHRLASSDDERALAVAAGHAGVRAAAAPGGGLTVAAEQETLDRYVLALGAHGIAVRRLERLDSPLESLFFALTGGEAEA